MPLQSFSKQSKKHTKHLKDGPGGVNKATAEENTGLYPRNRSFGGVTISVESAIGLQYPQYKNL